MTQRTRQANVRTGQRESSVVVIKGGVQPGNRRVTDGTIRREVRLHMVRIRGAVVVRHVAQVAGAAGQVVVVVHMALCALQVCVTVGQREAHGIVIETRRLPGGGVVAGLASLREIQRDVARVVRLLVVREVATHAGRGRSFEVVAHMACCALERRVHSGQGEAGVLQVVELNSKPVIEPMALLAGDRKACCRMVGARR